MDTPELEAFIAVAECSSFSRAADQLFLTQPAVSSRIAALERKLGKRLFDRLGKTILLTEAGESLLPRSRSILLAMEDASRAVSNLNEEVAGTLRLGTSHHIGLHRLPPVLSSFSRLFPAVKIDIRFIDSEEAFDAVIRGELELGIVTLPPIRNDTIKSELIWRDPLKFVACHEHPLTGKENLHISDLAKYPAVLPSEATFTRNIVKTLFLKNKLQVEIAITTNYLETLKMMSSIGLGWSVLPSTMIDDSISILNIKSVTLERELGGVYHSERTLSNAASQMLEILLNSRV